MRIIIDYNGSKVICRVTHYLNEKNPHYNDCTDIKDVEDDVFQIAVGAFEALANVLKKNIRKPIWMHKNEWNNRKGGKDVSL